MDYSMGVEGVMDLKDLRPWGWMICSECGHDCDDEADYDELEQRSTCPACRERQRQTDEERLALEVFARR
jgi:hypothetical protein